MSIVNLYTAESRIIFTVSVVPTANEKNSLQRHVDITHPCSNADANNPDTEIFDNWHFVKYRDTVVWYTVHHKNDNVWGMRPVSVRCVEDLRPGQSQALWHISADISICEISDGVGEWCWVGEVRQVKIKRRCVTSKQCYHSVNSRSHSVNGDIAIQWEWSNFDHSQNQNSLTDYDKTLHNWLRPWDEHVTQNFCQGGIWANTWNIRPNLFLLRFFFSDSPTEAIRGRIFTQSGSNYAQSRKKVPFWVCKMAENI